MDKIYWENHRWSVFLNRQNNIKVKRKSDGAVYDYINTLYHTSGIAPAYVRNRCKELHRMFQDHTIFHWINNYKKENGEKQ